MEKDLNLAQAFVATKAFLGIEFFINFSEGLDIVHAGFVINKCKENWQLEPETFDPSVWLDWMEAANEIIDFKIANHEITRVSELQAYQIMKKYIQNFANNFNFQDLIALFQKLNIDQQSDFEQSLPWKYWQLCVNATLKNKLTLIESVFGFETQISQTQAFEIMKLFLTDYFSKIENPEKYELFARIQNLKFESIRNDLIYKKWLQTYDSLVGKQSNENHETTIIQAYQIMRTFLESHRGILKFKKFKDLFSKIKIDDSQDPINYQTTYNWFHFAQQILLENALKPLTD